MKSKIREVIIVEGRDDTAAVLRAVDAQTIETHGFGMSDRMWEQIGTAARTRGIIIFTDPDRAGENIRRKVKERFPEAGEAFLSRDKALRGTNIGVENASPEAIREALARACCTKQDESEVFTMEDLEAAGLCGTEGSRLRREKVAAVLGIGYGNSRRMLARLNGFGITREEFYGAVRSICNPGDPE
ncbi:ribonuclease M5 [Hornefia butyriciproducens]|uniref:ribonuclease M5 n=1 Tax=Hornefia butyriciproducens TaxID=2652293 RepID=UPI003F886265